MWVNWYKSATAWKIIGSAVVAMVGAFASAALLDYPYNLIGAIAICIPCGWYMRRTAIKAMTKKGEGE